MEVLHMTLVKINGGFMSDKDEKFNDISEGELTRFGIDVYFVANTRINPTTGEFDVSYYTYINGGYGTCFSNDFENVVLYSDRKEAEKTSNILAGSNSVHHKIINREAQFNE